MENNESKNSKIKLNLIKIKQNKQQTDKIFQSQKKNDNEIEFKIIIELEMEIFYEKNEIYILCDKNTLIEDNKKNKDYYIKNNINPPKIFNYFNKEDTKLYLNDNEIELITN